MSAGTFVLAMLRVGIVLVGAGVAGWLIAVGLGHRGDALGRLAAAVIAISLVLVCAEALGLVGALHSAPLIAVVAGVAGVAWRWPRGQRSRTAPPPPTTTPTPTTARRASAVAIAVPALAVTIVLGQWLLASADALGGGMYNFDTLWYHMPFAAGFAQSGAVTGIHFTQADPWVAYYPANSELVHAVGLVLMHDDLLSPLINLGWLALLFAGAWCFGRPWRREPETLVAGCLLTGLPVLASTQPGEAFNDIAGLAMLVAAAALLVNGASPIVVGLALGFAVGVKFTFLVPVLIIAGGVCVARRGRAVAVVAALLVTGGWWYLRNLIRLGNPLGTRLHLGPLVLPGPRSPLASSQQQTVVSQLGHVSRLASGLTHMFGVLWPVLVLAAVLATVVAIVRGTPATRTLALAAAAAGLTYLVLPTGATGLGTGTVLFEVNLRYATPALALALLLLAVTAPAPRRLAAAMLVALIAASAERSLWPASPGRHLAFLILAGVITAAVAGARVRRISLRAPPVLAAGAALALIGGYVIQHHYLQRRYRAGLPSDPALGRLYAWSQTLAHARIALYGTLEQYPLYGALVTNRVDYLGAATGDGGYRPITTCAAWRDAVDRDRAQFVVMTPAPTGTAPLSWTASDPAARMVLAPGPNAAVFALTGPLNPRRC